jgi:nitroreductase
VTTTYAIQEMFRRAVVRATLAPSVHNTQPWRFVLRPGVLDVYAERGRQLGVLDPTGRQLHLSVGCAIFNARVSLAASGLSPAVRRLPDPAQPALLASIEVGDEPVDKQVAALDPVIGLRQTNRRRFASGEVPPELVSTLVSAAGCEGAILHPVIQEEDRMALARLMQRADSLEIADPAYRAELRAWTTTDPDRRDGVRALVVPHVDGTAGDEVPIRDFDSQGKGGLPAATQSGREQCLLLLGTSTDRPEAWLRVGEALERVWLEATRAGYVASLFSQPVEVAVIRAQLRTDLRLSMHPHMVIRVGRAPVTPASRRRHVADVLDDRTAG